eukprot:1140053-Pelagomonas_calceolata.AAC.2
MDLDRNNVPDAPPSPMKHYLGDFQQVAVNGLLSTRYAILFSKREDEVDEGLAATRSEKGGLSSNLEDSASGPTGLADICNGLVPMLWTSWSKLLDSFLSRPASLPAP